jgi:hypothetical protein
MSDRGQMGPGDLRLALPLVGVGVLAVILNRVYDADELAIRPTPEAACTLCHVEWEAVLPALGAVTALVVVSAVVARSGVAQSALRGGDDE